MKNIFGGMSPSSLGRHATENDPLTEIINLAGSLEAAKSAMVPIPKNNLNEIGQSIRQPNISGPMNVQFQDNEITPYQRATLGMRERELSSLEKQRESTRSTTQARQSLAEWRAQNPSMRIMPIKGGNIIAINPVTGEQIDLGIDSGTLSDEERLRIAQENSLERIDQTANERRASQEALGEQREREIALRGEEARRTRQTIPGRAVSPELPNQARTRLANQAQKLKIENPELGQYVTISPNGTISVNIPEGWTEAGKEQYKRIRSNIEKYLYGESPSDLGNTTTTTTTNTQTKTETGKIKVKAPDGQTGTWDLSKGPIPKGFTKIQ